MGEWEVSARAELYNRLKDLREDYEQTVERSAEDHTLKLVEMYEDYLESVTEAEVDYYRKLEEMSEDYEKDKARYAEDYSLKRSEVEEDYRDKELEELEDYQLDRTEIEEDYRRTDEEKAEDHQRRLERMEADHLEKMDDLIRVRDARGLLKEVQQYERSQVETVEDYTTDSGRRREDYEVKRAELEEQYALDKQRRLENYEDEKAEGEEEYALEQQRRLEDYEAKKAELAESYTREQEQRKEDYEAKRVDAEEAYALQAARRLEDFELRQQELRDEFAAERAVKLEEFAQRVEDLKVQHELELAEMKTAAGAVLAEMLGFYTREEEALRAHQGQLLIDMKAFLAEILPVQEGIDKLSVGLMALPLVMKGVKPNLADIWSNLPYHLPQGLASGGYANPGVYQLGEAGREFVLTAPTTRSLERQMGGPLSQGSFGGGSAIVVEQSNWQFHGSFTEGDKIWFRQAAKEAAYEGIVEVVSG